MSEEELQNNLKEAIRLGSVLYDLYENPELGKFIKNPAICKDLDKVLQAALSKLKYYIGQTTLQINRKNIKE